MFRMMSAEVGGEDMTHLPEIYQNDEYHFKSLGGSSTRVAIIAHVPTDNS